MATLTTAKVRKMPKDVTLEVGIRTTKEFRFRVWLAMKLIWLATVVLGCDVEFIHEDENEN
jgi:hypothetical protein